MPTYETIPRKRLTEHLKGAEFFNSKKYPISYFEITNVEPIIIDSLRIYGNLTIKNVTNNIEFTALYKNEMFSTKFIFDRFQWNIGSKGSLVDKTLVDKDIELTIQLKTQ